MFAVKSTFLATTEELEQARISSGKSSKRSQDAESHLSLVLNPAQTVEWESPPTPVRGNGLPDLNDLFELVIQLALKKTVETELISNMLRETFRPTGEQVLEYLENYCSTPMQAAHGVLNKDATDKYNVIQDWLKKDV